MDFKALYDQVPVGIAAFSSEEKVEYVNRSFANLLLYAPEELVGIPWRSVMAPQYLSLFIAYCKQERRGDQSDLHSTCMVNKAGYQTAVTLMATSPLVVDGRSFTLIIIHAQADSQQYHDRLFLEALMSSVPDSIYFKDTESRFLRVSSSFLNRFGIPDMSMLQGKTDFDLFTDEHAKQAYEDEQSILSTGKSILNIEEKETLQNDEVTWVSTTKLPFYDADGKILGTFGISRDITNHKLHETKLKENIRILNAITSKMPVIVYRYTKQQGFTALFGNSSLLEAFERSKVVKLPLKDNLLLIASKIAGQRGQQDYMNFSSSYSAPGGEVYFDNFLYENDNSDGELIGLALDVTERKQTEQNLKRNAKHLEKVNKELDQFAYIVSHDLKAPLRAMVTLSEWIEEDLKTVADAEVKEHLKLLKGRAKRMENLINGILTYSRIKRSQKAVKQINFHQVLTAVIDSLKIPESFVVKVPEQLPEIQYSKGDLERVLSNLLSNAVKYHHKSAGMIKIAYMDDERFHIFSIEDDGPGIEEAYHEKIFRIFQTLQPRDAIESTGIGLTIVKKIVEEWGGSIYVESNFQNGARFVFTIPKDISNSFIDNDE